MSMLARQRLGWYFYDFANSAFTTSVVTVFFGPYLTSVAEHAAVDGHLRILGLALHPGSWFSFCVSASVIMQLLLLPIVGAIADASHRKRQLLALTAFVGATATSALCVVQHDATSYLVGAGLFIIANASFGASIVVANSFLNDLATADERDKVSSRGWAFGYLGGGLALLLHLLWFKTATTGDEKSWTIRMILASTGLWWAVFTIIPLVLLAGIRRTVGKVRVGAAVTQLRDTLRHVKQHPQAARFLVAYVLYNEAIQTVISMASVYGSQELGLGLDVLTQAILLVQFVAIAGSLLFERMASRVGTLRAITISLFGWAAALLFAYVMPASGSWFYLLAVVIAIVLGGSQALSRSMFSRLIPHGREAEYFSLYEISDKGTAWFGPLTFGIVLSLTNSYRYALLSLIVFLLLGMVLLRRVRDDHTAVGHNTSNA
ncbi:MAG: MFS transporter [Candidatus Kapabacteria bacterium]|nr:MFS transporter [Candidatus Kapabacteria bacterium]